MAAEKAECLNSVSVSPQTLISPPAWSVSRHNHDRSELKSAGSKRKAGGTRVGEGKGCRGLCASVGRCSLKLLPVGTEGNGVGVSLRDVSTGITTL